MQKIDHVNADDHTAPLNRPAARELLPDAALRHGRELRHLPVACADPDVLTRTLATQLGDLGPTDEQGTGLSSV